MTDYVKNPDLGRLVKKEIVDKPKDVLPEAFDMMALANAVAQAINIKVPDVVQTESSQNCNYDDSFDSSSTMKKLATQMLVERGDNESNFDKLGNIKKTKRDQKDVDSTIDLLSKLDN